jgi:hypothetical protein
MIEQMPIKKPSVWRMTVHASFKKVIGFDLLFLTLGAMIGAGIIVAILLH